MSKAIITIPDSCKERFLPLQGHIAGPILDKGIILAGLSDLHPPYEVYRPKPKHHTLIYSIKGEAQFETIRTTGIFKPGTVWIAPAQQGHHYYAIRDWTFAWIHLTDSPQWSFLNEMDTTLKPTHLTSVILSAMERFITESFLDTADADKAAGCQAELLAIYLDRELQPASGAAVSDIQRRLQFLWEKVNANLQQEWPVKRLASFMHVSEVHFYRLVSRFHKTTPMDMILRLRMRRAEQLLLNTDYLLYQIAEWVGYNSPFSFSKTFKRCYGLSPGNYRKEHNSGIQFRNPDISRNTGQAISG